MGMMLDNSIETLTSILAEATANEDAVCYVTSTDAPALKMAVDTMRKYQKIEQIIKDIPYGGDVTVRRIQEVIEDGTDR